MVDCVIYPIRLKTFVLKDAELAGYVEELVYDGQKMLLIVVMLIGRLMWVYYQQMSNCCRPVLTSWLTDVCHQWLTDCWSCMTFCCDSFSFICCGSCVQWVMGFLIYGRCKQLFVSELNNAYFSKHLTENSVWVAKSCITVCFTYSWKWRVFEHRYFTR